APVADGRATTGIPAAAGARTKWGEGVPDRDSFGAFPGSVPEGADNEWTVGCGCEPVGSYDCSQHNDFSPPRLCGFKL
ncbi:MAG: hypothetical protein II481_06715, partial [Clostridia bacterium]|nr:hypothetical protein [Clostridia bacterium]